MGNQSSFDNPTQLEGEGTHDTKFLPNWDEHKWEKLRAYTTTSSFRAGDNVIQVGDADRAFYILLEGQLDVLIPAMGGQEMRSIRTFSEGAVVGEVAFIDGSPRTATIHALTDGKMLQVSVDDFDAFFESDPELGKEVLMDLGRLLTMKLRHANDLLSKWVK